MNLETFVDKALWGAIESSYNDKNYTFAILDTFHFIGNLIREKTGLESDGVELMGQAFGGDSPKLKVNKLQTQSERNVQKGTMLMLQGLYQAIRNPRSHEKFSDSKKNADAIIVFLNYQIEVINVSATPFSISNFLDRVLDPDFVENKEYAKLLIKEIPSRKKIDVFIQAYREKENSDAKKLAYFFTELYSDLSKQDKADVNNIISSELRETSDTDTIISILRILPDSNWPEYDQACRLRIENKLIKSIKKGRYSTSSKRCLDGSFGTWANGIHKFFTLKEELAEAIVSTIASDDDKVNQYGLIFLFECLPDLMPVPSSYVVLVIKRKLKEGNKKFFNKLQYDLPFEMLPIEWIEPLKESIDNFVEEEPVVEKESDDDLPF